MTRLPLDFVRGHFPGLGQGWALFDNAGGSVALEGVALAVADHLRHSAVQVGASYAISRRATDRVARAGPTRFHVLLPETSETEAAVLAERVRSTCATWGSAGPGLPLVIRAATGTPREGGTLHEALRAAQARLAS